MAKKKRLKASKLVKHVARKVIGPPKATRAESSKVKKFKGGRASKKGDGEAGNFDSSDW